MSTLYQRKFSDPATEPYNVTPHDTNPLPRGSRSLYIGTGGTIVLKGIDAESNATFQSVPSGSILPVAASHVRATGTTASNIVALV